MDTKTNPTVGDVLADPTTRTWLRDALRAALRRDPVDAVNDARILLRVLEVRCDTILQDKGGESGPPYDAATATGMYDRDEG